MVRQVMQSANCALARQLKNVLVDLTRDIVVHQMKPAMNENWTVMLCWAPYMLSTMPMILYYQAYLNSDNK